MFAVDSLVSISANRDQKRRLEMNQRLSHNLQATGRHALIESLHRAVTRRLRPMGQAHSEFTQLFIELGCAVMASIHRPPEEIASLLGIFEYPQRDVRLDRLHDHIASS
ncbi:MAG: hypothetical protein ABI682_03985 [Acidobacteriota bacterium]